MFPPPLHVYYIDLRINGSQIGVKVYFRHTFCTLHHLIDLFMFNVPFHTPGSYWCLFGIGNTLLVLKFPPHRVFYMYDYTWNRSIKLGSRDISLAPDWEGDWTQDFVQSVGQQSTLYKRLVSILTEFEILRWIVLHCIRFTTRVWY